MLVVKETEKEKSPSPPVQEPPAQHRGPQATKRAWRRWALLGLIPVGFFVFWGITHGPLLIVAPIVEFLPAKPSFLAPASKPENEKPPPVVEPPEPATPDQQVLQEINDRLKLGKKYMGKGASPDAMEQFEAILKLGPTNKDAVAWRDRAKKAQALEKNLEQDRARMRRTCSCLTQTLHSPVT